MSYTAAQKKAYAKKMAGARAKKTYVYRGPKSLPPYYKPKRYNNAGSNPRSNDVVTLLTPSRIGNQSLQYPGVGAKIGKYVGPISGNLAQHLIKHITGFGDYRISSNSIMSGGMTPPQVVNVANRNGVIVRHREYIADILATTAFTIQTFDLNPGLYSTFPWLATLAYGFEQYQFRGMVFEFKSLSSDAVVSTNANAGLGAVIMATQYNSLSPVFADKKTMENYEFANSAKPSECFIHPIECKRNQTPVDLLYVRTGAIASGSDQRLYDLGQFSIATTGMQANAGVVGELWVSFEVEFYKPKLLLADGLELLTDHFMLQTVTNAAPLGTTSVIDGAADTLGTTISTSGLVITFPNSVSTGTYLLNYTVRGGSTALTVSVVTPNASCSFAQVWASNTLTSVNTPTGTTSTIAFINIIVIVNTAGNNDVAATLTFGSATLPTSVTSGDLWITQINNLAN